MEPIKRHALFLAPMEGVTDPLYRELMQELYPRWDYMACDFLRIPYHGRFPLSKIRSHYGEDILAHPQWREKNYLQILASESSFLAPMVQQIEELGIPWIDLNLGCPSKTVSGHGGGSYLLSDLPVLEKIVTQLRDLIRGRFTVKIRVGFHDDRHFKNILSLLEYAGVEAITIHGRTRDQMYKGRANWQYIKEAVQQCSIPIIGNGDIWSLEDIERIFDHTQCHAIMLARPALQTPWMSELYYDYQDRLFAIAQDHNFLTEIRQAETPRYFYRFFTKCQQRGLPEHIILKRMKSLTRYILADHPRGTSHFLRARSPEVWFS